MHALSGSHQAILQLTQRVLTGTNDHRIHRQHLRLAIGNADMQTGLVNLQVLNTVEHLHVLVLQACTVNPTGGFTQTVAHLGLFALQQEHLACRRMGLCLYASNTAASLQLGIDAPLLPERFTAEAGGFALVSDELGNVKTNAACANHGNRLANRLALQNSVQVVDDLRTLDTWNLRRARSDTGRQDDLIKTASNQIIDIDTGVQTQINPCGFQLALEVTQGFKELFLARHLLGHVELSADLAGRIEQGHAVATLGRYSGRRQACWAGTHHRDFLHLGGGDVVQLSLMAGTRVDQAAGQLAAKGVVQAGLVTADAGVDFIRTAFSRLIDELRVSEERTGHGDHRSEEHTS